MTPMMPPQATGGLLQILPSQFEYGGQVTGAPIDQAQVGVLQSLAAMASVSPEDASRMKKSGMDPNSLEDIKRYREAMSSLSGRIQNVGDRIANVPNRIAGAADKVRGLFDVFGGDE